MHTQGFWDHERALEFFKISGGPARPTLLINLSRPGCPATETLLKRIRETKDVRLFKPDGDDDTLVESQPEDVTIMVIPTDQARIKSNTIAIFWPHLDAVLFSDSPKPLEDLQ